MFPASGSQHTTHDGHGMVWHIFHFSSSFVIHHSEPPITHPSSTSQHPSMHPSIHSSILYELLKPWALGGIGTPDHMYLYLHIYTHTVHSVHNFVMLSTNQFPESFDECMFWGFWSQWRKRRSSEKSGGNRQKFPTFALCFKAANHFPAALGDKHCKGNCFPKCTVQKCSLRYSVTWPLLAVVSERAIRIRRCAKMQHLFAPPDTRIDADSD